ncbi:hypothetical protein ANO14919_037580 [Xylariales sp. No.14919]|nr:hypothetical protein ANO14919_037580 [Xylariales sp. No.14919]
MVTKIWEAILLARSSVTASLVLTAASPGMPNIARPVVIVQYHTLGPRGVSIKVYAPWKDSDIKEKAMMAKPGSLGLTTMNMVCGVMMA